MRNSKSFSARPAWIAGAVLIVLSLALAACAPYAAAAQGPTATAAPAGAAPSATPLIPVTGGAAVQVVNNPKFGQILVTSSGMTLYTFAIDQAGVSRCESSSCVAYWPPYTASAQPVVAPQVEGKIGLITRSDGTMQLTFNEMPLYTFIADKKPGDVQGDNVNQFGGLWHVAAIGGASGASSGGGSIYTSGSSGGY